MTGNRNEHRNVPGSTNEGAGGVGHDGAVRKEQESDLRRDDRQDGGDAIPDSARNDFTFPDEQGELGRRSGDDLPGEAGEDRT